MGQQQLILLVLATVIVGVAIVVGIRAFTENSAKSNADAMMQQAVRIANDAQAWKKKPAPFGGQASTQTQAVVSAPADFSGATWAALGYNDDGAGNYVNLDGSFTIAPTATATTITGTNAQEDNTVVVTLDGMTDTDIAGSITCLGGTNPADGTTC